ncbi:histidinol phosphate phosphatase domain-containing protein [Thermicanus aegyptius]|uniref:histidinol phosphate phosphatase domain-containing protein n=1 Tax=Thermicanus aegyptius TaxID=94009 RepID=UPI0003F5E120|nr:histidinol phosphate phosphatase domain-containing protein [Thermicanus aegyptius]
MKVDYHVHLEEGPYSLTWWRRTAKALHFFPIEAGGMGRTERIPRDPMWIRRIHEAMGSRILEGAYSPRWMDLYLYRAKELELKEVGIVDHLYRFREMRGYFERYIDLSGSRLGRMQRDWLDAVCVESLDRFVARIEEERERWKKAGISLKLGLEADYFPGGEEELSCVLSKYPWDYVIGSIHFLDGWGFDNPETKHFFQDMDLERLYDRFFSMVMQAIRSGLFDIIGHLDNIKVFGYRPDEQFLSPYYRQIADLLAERDGATEINTGLSYRYPVKEACPAPHFLQILAEKGVAITTSSDAHFPDDLGTGLTEARIELRNVGFHSIIGFEKRKRIVYPFEE